MCFFPVKKKHPFPFRTDRILGRETGQITDSEGEFGLHNAQLLFFPPSFIESKMYFMDSGRALPKAIIGILNAPNRLQMLSKVVALRLIPKSR